MTQRRLLEVSVVLLRPAVVRVVGHPHNLEGRHKSHAFGGARWPLRLRQLLERHASDTLSGHVFTLLRDALGLEAGAVQSCRCAHAAVLAGVMPSDAN